MILLIPRPVLPSPRVPVLPESPLALRVLPRPVTTMLRIRRMHLLSLNLPLLRPKYLCVVVCRASRAESRGLRKVSLLPEPRPPVLLLRPQCRPKPPLPKSQLPKSQRPSSRTKSPRLPRLPPQQRLESVP
ncbi:hypothetical protein JCM18882A_00040 [Brevibacterium metallidurans]|uniref:Uncharacterized protein n=1 Tax=Brevibacterium metallidurans TaxID=1482676 RepID=A0ABN0SIH0_9MICO